MYLQALGQLPCQTSVYKDLAHISVQEKGIGNTPQSGSSNIGCLPINSISCERSETLSSKSDFCVQPNHFPSYIAAVYRTGVLGICSVLAKLQKSLHTLCDDICVRNKADFVAKVVSDLRAVVRFFSRRSFLSKSSNSATCVNFAVTDISLILEARMIVSTLFG